MMKRLERCEIKSWFLKKNNITALAKEFEIERETEKAVLAKSTYTVGYERCELKVWIPKSCLQDPKDDAFYVGSKYHEYLVNVYHESYEAGLVGEKFTIKSGRNRYSGDNFIHQDTSEQILKRLNKFGINVMSKEEFREAM